MDPQQTWTDLLDALKQNDDEAKELAVALLKWLRKGGFPPVTVGDESLGKNWHKTIASFTCLVVANKVDDVRKRRNQRQTRTKGGD